MPLEEQMAGLTVDERLQRWYAEAVQRKHCSCHMKSNGWCEDMNEQGVHLPREDLEHLVCLACREQPKRFILNIDLMMED